MKNINEVFKTVKSRIKIASAFWHKIKWYKKAVAVIAISLIAVLGTGYYLNSLNTEYLIDIKNSQTFNEISTGYVYFGRPTCPSCRLFQPLLSDVAREQKVQVYYFNTDYFRENSILSEDELQTIFKKYKIESVPILIKLVNGSLDSSFGADFVEDQSPKIKNEMRDFISYKEFPAKYIPHYTLIIALFVISLLAILISFLSRKKADRKAFSFALLMINVTSFVILLLSIKPIMDYIKNNHLSLDPKMLIISVILIVINLFMSFRYIKMYYKHFLINKT